MERKRTSAVEAGSDFEPSAPRLVRYSIRGGRKRKLRGSGRFTFASFGGIVDENASKTRLGGIGHNSTGIRIILLGLG